MRKTLGMIVAAGIFGCMPAMAQTSAPTGPAPMAGQSDALQLSRPPGNGSPFSSQASNIDQSDSRTNIAPTLPQPPQGENASVRVLLRDARIAVQRRQTGAAQEALEQAETRLLTRSVRQSTEAEPARGPVVGAISDARHALARHDMEACLAAIDRAMQGMTGG
jgi:hypothetical protein